MSKRKAYAVTLNSRGGKRIYVESLNRKRAVEAADRVLAHDQPGWPRRNRWAEFKEWLFRDD